MSDKASTKVHVVRSKTGIADGAWHGVECRRAGSALTIVVDGQVRGAATIPATLSVVTTQPFSLGGRGTGEKNNQFHGSLDDVWISVG